VDAAVVGVVVAGVAAIKLHLHPPQ
jgi:hypothetical protein